MINNAGTILMAAAAAVILGATAPATWAQAPAAAAGGASAATGVTLELTPDSQVRYRVREQLAGIPFPSDAVGLASGVTGTLVIGPDGAFVSSGSKLTLDLRTFRSDQDRRDAFLQRRTLETEKFPLAEFVPRRAVGMPYPFPSEPPAQAGFQLIGDMTMHGVTSELTWNVVAAFVDGRVAGIATTSFQFEKFGLEKPSLARLMSVDDNINLELEFRATITPTTR